MGGTYQSGSSGGGSGTLGTLAYAATATNQGGIQAETDVTGAVITPTIGAGRRIRLSFGGICSDTTTAGTTIGIRIREGATQILFTRFETYSASAGTGLYVYGSVIITPTAGAHTYKLTATIDNGGGTGQVNGGTYILAEDIGT